MGEWDGGTPSLVPCMKPSDVLSVEIFSNILAPAGFGQLLSLALWFLNYKHISFMLHAPAYITSVLLLPQHASPVTCAQSEPAHIFEKNIVPITLAFCHDCQLCSMVDHTVEQVLVLLLGWHHSIALSPCVTSGLLGSPPCTWDCAGSHNKLCDHAHASSRNPWTTCAFCLGSQSGRIRWKKPKNKVIFFGLIFVFWSLTKI